MFKKLISISFVLLFVTTIALPTIITLVDDSAEISFYNDFSEEEEEKGNEKNNEFELFQSELEQNITIVFTEKKQTEVTYRFKTYAKPHLNLISPPPDFTI